MDLTFFDGSLGLPGLLFLMLALGIALGFEFVNGFHDTANAVATVIYTRSLSPLRAVLWSGLCNFLGVYVGGIAVAFSIVYLLPVDLLIAIGSGAGMAMVLALLTAAIMWNSGTWYLGLPASSSHTLIGAILGVGLASSALPGHDFGSGVNWVKAGEVGLSLLLSPLLGFGAAGALLLLFKTIVRNPQLHSPPVGDQPPPPWVRAILIVTCTGVSFAHGSNDGQKGIGLIMLILIGLLPAQYALNLDYRTEDIAHTVQTAQELEQLLAMGDAGARPVGREDTTARPHSAEAGSIDLARLRRELAEIRSTLRGQATLRDISPEERWNVRTDILKLNDQLRRLECDDGSLLSEEQWHHVTKLRARLDEITNYAPTWVLMAVACALGVGTTVGWKRIVVTVGEKIGKTHMTYAQGASAELVAMSTIGLADFYGLPVSTTHVLASGIAGTMAANRSGLQRSTIRNILLAWVLTLPVSMLLAGSLFLLFRLVLA